jgi:hypothetical protein
VGQLVCHVGVVVRRDDRRRTTVKGTTVMGGAPMIECSV